MDAPQRAPICDPTTGIVNPIWLNYFNGRETSTALALLPAAALTTLSHTEQLALIDLAIADLQARMVEITPGGGRVNPLTITNLEVSDTAAIAYSKLNLTGAIVDADIVSVSWNKLLDIPAVIQTLSVLVDAAGALTNDGFGVLSWDPSGGGGGGGTVTAVSVATANGFAGGSSGGATPILTLSTTVTGVIKGNGTALSAATAGTDYSVGTSALATGLVKSTTTTGVLSIAVAATDYVAPSAYASANGLTMATARLLGRTTAASGPAEEISIAGALTLVAGVLTGTGTGTVTGTGTAGTIPKWTSASALGNSILTEAAGVLSVAGDTTVQGLARAQSLIVHDGSGGTTPDLSVINQFAVDGSRAIGMTLLGGDLVDPNVINLCSGTIAYSTSSGVTISYRDKTANVWRAALSIRNIAGLGTLNLMTAGGTVAVGNLLTATSVTATTFTGALVGNASTATTAAAWTTARNLAGNSVDGSANVAFANKFIVQGTADAGLSAAQFLGALGTGIVKNTTTTGVLSIAIAADFPTLNQSTSGNAATATLAAAATILATARAINGVNFDGSAAITVTAAAGTLTGTVLNATVVTSSLTTLGTVTAAGNVDLLNAVNTHTAAGTHTWSAGASNRIRVLNTATGATETASFQATAGTANLFLFAYSQGYTSTAYEIADGGAFLISTAGGVSVAAVNAAATVRIFAGSTTVPGMVFALRGITIGAAALPSTGTDVLVFPDGTIPATMASNTAALYADDVGGTVNMFGIAEDGSITRLTYPTGQTYAASNVTTDRTYDANATTMDELADVVGTLIADLRARGQVV